MEKYKRIWILRTLRAVAEWLTSSPWRYFTLIFLISVTVRIYQLNRLASTYPDYLAPTGERENEAIAISL